MIQLPWRQSSPASPPALPQVTSSETSQRASLSTISLPNRARGMAFGMTGSGKSVLTHHLMLDWLRRYPATARVLIVDSKPNYRAMWRLNGTNAKGEYKRMEREAPVTDSVLLPLSSHGELKQVWAQGHHVAIAQIPNLSYLGALQAVMSEFYEKSDARYHQLALVDEMADFYSSSGGYARADSLVQIIRSGRKRGVALLGCSQRPRSIPGSVISEATNLYIFGLAMRDDRKRLEEAGLPDDFHLPSQDYEFFYFTRRGRQRGTYRLALSEEAA